MLHPRRVVVVVGGAEDTEGHRRRSGRGAREDQLHRPRLVVREHEGPVEDHVAEDERPRAEEPRAREQRHGEVAGPRHHDAPVDPMVREQGQRVTAEASLEHDGLEQRRSQPAPEDAEA